MRWMYYKEEYFTCYYPPNGVDYAIRMEICVSYVSSLCLFFKGVEPLYIMHGLLLGDAGEHKTNILFVEKFRGPHKIHKIWRLPIACYIMESMAGEK